MITAISPETPLLPMSAALRNVLGVIEEIERNGIMVITLDMPFADEPTIGIDAGPELDGEEIERYRLGTTLGPMMESRRMIYRGCAIEWAFKIKEAAHG
jgi:hypothetical protein